MDFMSSYFGKKVHALSNFEINDYAEKLGIPYWRGVFMRDTLPKSVSKYETGIVNLDTNSGPGTHWVAYYKKDREVQYYDSFGVQPPPELIKYFGSGCTIFYNSEQEQKISDVICGQLCLKFLYKNK